MRSEGKCRKRLEDELQGSAYQVLLRRLQCNHVFFHRFDTWASVIGFMRRGSSSDAGKDRILRPILCIQAEDGDPRWGAVLLTMLWPMLMSICRRKWHWDKNEPDELQQRVFWAFHESVYRIDVSKRPNRIAPKLINDTIHRLYESYWRDWKRAKREIITDPVDMDLLASHVAGINFDGLERREIREREIRRYRKHLEAGRITKAEFQLLVHTRLDGYTIAEHARAVGLGRECAKKRRWRAEAKIRHHEKKLQ